MSNRPLRRYRRAMLAAGTLEQRLRHNVARVNRKARRMLALATLLPAWMLTAEERFANDFIVHKAHALMERNAKRAERAAGQIVRHLERAA